MDKNKIITIISICLLCVVVIGSTVGYYNEKLFDDLTVDTITNGLDYYINYTKGQNISGATLVPTSDYTKNEETSTSISLYKKDNTYDIYGHIYLDINAIGATLAEFSALKYTLVNNDNVIAEGTLKGNTSNDSVLLKSNISLETTEQIFTVYIWLDENEELDIEAENETLSVTVRCEATMKTIMP